MNRRNLDYYLKEWRDNVEKTIHIQYDSPASVRKNNRAVDRYRKSRCTDYPAETENGADGG